MAALVDASSPARVSATVTPGTLGPTTASFTAPAKSLLLAHVTLEATSNVGADLDLIDSGGLDWEPLVAHDQSETIDGGYSAWWVAIAPTSASRTVSVNWSGPGGRGGTSGSDRPISLKVYVVTGADVDGTPVDTVGAANEGSSTVNSMTTTNVTPGANGLLFVGDFNYASLGGHDASSDLTQEAIQQNSTVWDSGGYTLDIMSGYKAVTAGVPTNGNINAGGSGTAQHEWVQIVVREAPDTGSAELEIDGAVHAHVSDSIVLTQANTLSIDDVIHAQASGSVSLTQASSLSIAGTAHAHVAGSAGLTQANVIAIASAVHAHLASSIDLVQAGTLSVGDAQHGQAATGVALAQASSLDVSGIVHALASSSPTLSQHGALAIDDAAHEQAASELSLTQASVLEVDGAAHELVSDEPVIPARNALSIPKSTHGQTSDDVTLVQAHVLDLDDSAHSLVSTQVAVSQALVLSVADAMHGTFGDSIELSVSQMLAVSAAAHLHASDPIALTQAHVLIMSDALHAQIAQQLNLVKPADLSGAELFIVKAEDRFYIVAPTERYMVH